MHLSCTHRKSGLQEVGIFCDASWRQGLWMPLVTDIHTGKKAAVLLLCCVVTLPLWKYPCTRIFHNHILNVHADLRRNNRLVVCVISSVSFFFDAYLCPCSLPHFLLHLLLYTEPWIACKLHCCFLVKKKKRKSVEETHSSFVIAYYIYCAW